MKSTIEGGTREANSQRRMIERGTEWKQQNKDMLGQLENINGERLARDYILEPNDIRTEDFEDTTTLEEIRRILTEQLGVMSTAFDQKKQEINKRRRGVDYDEPLYKELEAQIETLRGDLGQRIGELNSFINRFTKRFFEGGYNDSTDKTEYTPWGPKTLGEAKKEISGYILEEENERKKMAEKKKETDEAIKAALALARSKAE
jgi:hypothetical protein